MAEPADLVAVILADAPDPMEAASTLLHAITGGSTDGFPSDLLAELDGLLPPGDLVGRAAAVESGARLAVLRHGRADPDPWDLVLTGPSDLRSQVGEIRYSTSGALTRLILDARRQVRIYAPFTTKSGLELLAEPLSRALRRATRLELTIPSHDTDLTDLFSRLPPGLVAAIHLRRMRASESDLWSHLKVVTVDGSAAYVGSANISKSGLAGRNVELGVVVRGPRVRVIDRLVDELTDVYDVGDGDVPHGQR